jgi:beta-phosphoglucomutase-like phosphatase (HAD superfamily)
VRAGALTLRPGIARLVDEANHAGLPLAIATTTTPDNIDALLATPFGEHWRQRFAIVCDASSATAKKPAPDVYLPVLRHLGLEGASCLALEDSENGLRAARAAGVPVVITTTAYTEFQCFDGALRVLPELGDPGRPVVSADADDPTAWIDLAALRRMHEH